MTDPESKGLVTKVLDMITNVPEPVVKASIIALAKLLDKPRAYWRQNTQAIHDVTDGRSLVSAELAKHVALKISRDPQLMDAAMEVYTPLALRKEQKEQREQGVRREPFLSSGLEGSPIERYSPHEQRKEENRLSVAQSAADHIKETEWTGVNADGVAPPDDDWMNRFMRLAEDASSERLRDMFGRILAGEIVHPGAFGLATLRIVSELDQSLANDFNHAWSQSVGASVDYSPEWQSGEGFARWQRLIEVGLMAPSVVMQSAPSPHPIVGHVIWVPMGVGHTLLRAEYKADSTPRWKHIAFTKAGQEIGRILERPDYEQNLRRAASSLPRPGLIQITLQCSANRSEIVWQAGGDAVGPSSKG